MIDPEKKKSGISTENFVYEIIFSRIILAIFSLVKTRLKVIADKAQNHI